MLANAKKTKPVTSSQSCPRTRPQWTAVARQPFMTAAKVRVFFTCLPATFAAMPTMRAVETFPITVDFIKLQRYNYAAVSRSIVTREGIQGIRIESAFG